MIDTVFFFLYAAAETTAPTEEVSAISNFLQYGVLGAFAVLLVIYAKTVTKREQERGDRLEKMLAEKNAEFNALLKDILPPLAEINKTNAELTAQVQRLTIQLEVERASHGNKR